MQALKSAFFTLVEFTIVDSKTPPKEAWEQVANHAGYLEQNAPNILQDIYSKALFRSLKSQAQTASLASKSYQQQLARSITQTCVACHTSGTSSKQASFFTGSELSPGLKRAEVLDQAYFYIATRNFSEGIKILQGLVESPKESYVNKTKAIYTLLSTWIQEGNPKDAIVFLESAKSKKALPSYLNEPAIQWLADLKFWQARSAKFSSKQWMKKASSIGIYPGDERARVSWMITSAMLRKNAKMNKDAKDLLDLGRIYQGLSLNQLPEMPGLYFEACIYMDPKSTTAKNCYIEYEKEVIFSFSGSAGVDLPEDVQKHLDSLRKMVTLSPLL